jgi:hypothetical protein
MRGGGAGLGLPRPHSDKLCLIFGKCALSRPSPPVIAVWLMGSATYCAAGGTVGLGGALFAPAAHPKTVAALSARALGLGATAEPAGRDDNRFRADAGATVRHPVCCCYACDAGVAFNRRKSEQAGQRESSELQAIEQSHSRSPLVFHVIFAAYRRRYVPALHATAARMPATV